MGCSEFKVGFWSKNENEVLYQTIEKNSLKYLMKTFAWEQSVWCIAVYECC